MLNSPIAPWPNYSEAEAKIVTDVLKSNKVNYWTGTQGREFEKEFADYTGVSHAIAVANGTLALELALRAIDIQPGDEVIVTSRSFMASASSIVVQGGTPVFADVEKNSQNVSARTIEKVITDKTKAIICVHLAGWMCEMDAICQLAEKKNLWVIEDCAQAHGASYKNKKAGSWGHINAFSFCQDKIMTTAGEGGMVTTNNKELWKKAWAYKDHGKSYDAVYNNQHPPGFRWLHESFGSNWRLTEIQSAVGRYQLKLLDSWVEERRNNAKTYSTTLAEFPAVRLTQPDEDVYHSYYKYYFFIDPQELAQDWTQDKLIEALNKEGLPAFSGSCSEMYLEKAFEHFQQPVLPNAHELSQASYMLLVHPGITNAQMAKMQSALTKVLKQAL
ncbi:MAG: DegT/DnrJ/EryC1/StrS aminotransferase family protein [Gammaproteobacteria bacterium]|nr:DegT/DnrJ/EryC1/StrS aminotransferase family protein [Gammaproteobacteria bacterium]